MNRTAQWATLFPLVIQGKVYECVVHDHFQGRMNNETSGDSRVTYNSVTMECQYSWKPSWNGSNYFLKVTRVSTQSEINPFDITR